MGGSLKYNPTVNNISTYFLIFILSIPMYLIPNKLSLGINFKIIFWKNLSNILSYPEHEQKRTHWLLEVNIFLLKVLSLGPVKWWKLTIKVILINCNNYYLLHIMCIKTALVEKLSKLYFCKQRCLVFKSW